MWSAVWLQMQSNSLNPPTQLLTRPNARVYRHSPCHIDHWVGYCSRATFTLTQCPCVAHVHCACFLSHRMFGVYKNDNVVWLCIRVCDPSLTDYVGTAALVTCTGMSASLYSQLVSPLCQTRTICCFSHGLLSPKKKICFHLFSTNHQVIHLMLKKPKSQVITVEQTLEVCLPIVCGTFILQ